MSGQRAALEPYDVEITAGGRRNLVRLPEKIADAVHAFVFEALSARPQRVGKPLVGEFKGLWSARREQYRVVYKIDDLRHVVLIHRVAHHRDVYRPR
ncbi:MAG TPA: type II toxin-antitoxin system RelE/ParE family toxin [Pseudonocardiaceae bacterium]|nr:type II toxin-antitoxin system RelE/ParE family toxin [Pseudonocardiaceae bacterium]